MSEREFFPNRNLDSQAKSYPSFTEWKHKTFPGIARKQKLKSLENNPKLLGRLAGKEIINQIRSELLNNSQKGNEE